MSGLDELYPPRIESLYIHVPFCGKRCGYCDFPTNATAPDDPLIDEYMGALAQRVRFLVRGGYLADLDTIYLGGGTPSFLGQARLVRFIYLLSLNINLHENLEFTLEANPGSFTERMFHDLWALGVNRYSLGVQSFDDEVLLRLGRIHTAAQAEEAIGWLCERDANFSIDLMCGIPGLSDESWRKSLERAVSLGVPHVSIYPLQVEDDTPFARAIEDGSMDEPSEDATAHQMEMAKTVLGEAGLERYEVASYAKPGFESRHNTAYWTQKSYLGLGSGAASALPPTLFDSLVTDGFLQPYPDEDSNPAAQTDPVLVRFDSRVDAATFSDCSPLEETELLGGGIAPVPVATELLDASQVACEAAMLRMRMAKGLDTRLLEQLTGDVPALKSAIDELCSLGLAILDETRGAYLPTERGWLMGNELFERIWSCADGAQGQNM